MEFASQRRWSFFVIVFFMFFSGVEYAVVFPTLWEYLQTLGIPRSQVYYLGFCISALTVTDMFVGLAVGRLLDKCSRTGTIVLSLNIFQVLGSALYLAARKPYWILVSRLIAGIGNVATVAFITDVCRATTLQERTPILVAFNIARQIGLLFGPACNLFLRGFNFDLFGIHVTKLNAPGLFMMVVYIVFELLVGLAYYDLYRAKLQLRQQQQEEQSDAGSSDQNVSRNESVSSTASAPVPVTWRLYAEEIIREEVVAMIFLRFIALFGQTCLETIATPFMKNYFNYDDLGNSVLYLLGGIELVFVSIAMAFIARKVSDRSFVTVGILMNMITYIWLMACVPKFKYDDRSSLPYFAVGVILDLASVSIVLDIGMALLTKLVKEEVQGMATGVRRFFGNLALLLGPLWGGSALPWPLLLFAVPLGLLIVGSIFYGLSYGRMVPRSSPEQRQSQDSQPVVEEEHAADESTPLLRAQHDENSIQA